MKTFELEIEKNIYEGLGLSHFENKAVFVKGAIEKEVVLLNLKNEKKNFINAEIVEIIKPSDKRIKPVCPMSKPCGACDLAFIEYDYLCGLKEKMVKEIFQNFKNLKFLPVIKSPETKEYRCKAQYPVSQTKNSKRILIGYYKEKTHEVVNIKYCPIQPKIIDEVIDFVRNNFRLSIYDEKTHKGLLRHVNTRFSKHSNEILLTLVLNDEKIEFEKHKKEIEKFSDELCEKFIDIKGVLVNFNPNKTNKITTDETILIKGRDFIFEKLSNSIYKIGSNSFFQINPKCAELLFEAAKKLITKKGDILDLYGGVGTIGIYMKDLAKKIILVEENKEATALAKENFELNKISNYEIFETCTKDKIKEFIKENRTFENIIIDPPRKGSDSETLDAVSKMTNSIIYISCNPMTLKRDSEILIQKGFRFVSVQPCDMFPYTHHIECVAHFIKEGE